MYWSPVGLVLDLHLFLSTLVLPRDLYLMPLYGLRVLNSARDVEGMGDGSWNKSTSW